VISHLEHRRIEAATEEIIRKARHRSEQYRQLDRFGVAKDITGGCGKVRVNARGELLDIEIDVRNARTVGENQLAKRILDAIGQAETQAKTVDELIAAQD
jgi:hypothetical protein